MLFTVSSEDFSEGEKCHRDEQVEEPVGHGGDGNASTAGPQGVDLGVYCPRHGTHS